MRLAVLDMLDGWLVCSDQGGVRGVHLQLALPAFHDSHKFVEHAPFVPVESTFFPDRKT
jgi:hypothetical protein